MLTFRRDSVFSQSLFNMSLFCSTVAVLVVIIPVCPRVFSHSFSRMLGAHSVLPAFMFLTCSSISFAFSLFSLTSSNTYWQDLLWELFSSYRNSVCPLNLITSILLEAKLKHLMLLSWRGMWMGW